MKKVKDLLKNNLVLGILIGGVLFGSIGIVIATSIESEAILYSNEANENVTTVEEALNDLYNRAPSTQNFKSSTITLNNIKLNFYNTDDYEVTSDYLSTFSTGIYYHDGDSTTDAGDLSYRYFGQNPNNWVCFGYSDVSSCSEETFNEESEYAYRIIGFFNKNFEDSNLEPEYQIKLIKADWATTAQLGTGQNSGDDNFSWTGSNQNNSNTWSVSTLNTIALNDYYINTYLAGNNTIWSTMIDQQHVWKVGGNTLANIAQKEAKTAYMNEIVNPVTNFTSDNKIEDTFAVGLMYVSDYLYSFTPTFWNNKADSLSDYTGYTWLFNSSKIEYFLTRRSDFTYYYHVFMIYTYGNVAGTDNWTYRGVRPTFYLKSNVKLKSGTGTVSDPYIISYN